MAPKSKDEVIEELTALKVEFDPEADYRDLCDLLKSKMPDPKPMLAPPTPQQELEALSKKCLKADGMPKKGASVTDLDRIAALKMEIDELADIEKDEAKEKANQESIEREKIAAANRTYPSFQEHWMHVEDVRLCCLREGILRPGQSKERNARGQGYLDLYKG